jgi:hypothetical protein
MTDIAFRDLAYTLNKEPLPDTSNEKTGPTLAINRLNTQLTSLCVLQNDMSSFSDKLGYEIGRYGDALVGFVLRNDAPVTINLKYAGSDIHQPDIILSSNGDFSFAFQGKYIIPLLCMQYNILSMTISPPERAMDVCLVYAYFRDEVRREIGTKQCYARLQDGQVVQFTSSYGIINPVEKPTFATVELLDMNIEY